MRMLAALVVLVGCASANNRSPNGDDDPVDAPDVDPPVDSPDQPVTVTLSQTTSSNIAAGNSLNCNVGGGETTENHYYRVFPLAMMGVTDEFSLTKVTFGVESAAQNIITGPAAGTQNVTLNVGTYAGAFDGTTTSLTLAMLSAPISTATVAVPDGTLTTVEAPITATIPAGSKLYVEIVSPRVTNQAFFPGSNNGGEMFPGFIRANDCGINNPTNYSMVQAGTQIHLVLTVTGMH